MIRESLHFNVITRFNNKWPEKNAEYSVIFFDQIM